MKRNFLFTWYQTPRGKLQRQLETDYLRRSITVSCKQHILQIGGLGWENKFIDVDLYSNYFIVDIKGQGHPKAKLIRAKAHHLPIQSDSMDMVIVPHLLEFDISRFQTMREIERILKCEGVLVILGFNPWSVWVRYQYVWEKRMADSWTGHFISRSRILDWLKLLNFEVISLSQFNFDCVETTHNITPGGLYSIFATSYAVRAIKRRYNIIPLTPVLEAKPQIAMANPMYYQPKQDSYE